MRDRNLVGVVLREVFRKSKTGRQVRQQQGQERFIWSTAAGTSAARSSGSVGSDRPEGSCENSGRDEPIRLCALTTLT